MDEMLKIFERQAESVQKELNEKPETKDREYLCGKLVAYIEIISELKARS